MDKVGQFGDREEQNVDTAGFGLRSISDELEETRKAVEQRLKDLNMVIGFLKQNPELNEAVTRIVKG